MQRVLLSGPNRAPCVHKEYRDEAARVDKRVMRIAGLIGLILVGCGGIARVDGRDPMSPKELIDPLFEAYAEDPAQSLPINGPVNLDVDIFRGDVLVRRAEGLEFPRLITTRSADFGAGRSEDGFLALDDVQIQATLEAGPEGPVLVIRANSGHPDADQMRTDLILELPEPSMVRVHTGHGHVEVRGCTGPVDAQTNEGNVLVRTHRPLQGNVTAISNLGAALVAVRGESEAMIDVEARGGDARSRVLGASLKVLPNTTSSRFQGVMNNGTWRVTVRATEANASFHAIPNPEFTAFNFKTP